VYPRAFADFDLKFVEASRSIDEADSQKHFIPAPPLKLPDHFCAFEPLNTEPLSDILSRQ